MRIRVSTDTTDAEAQAIAEAMASQYRDDVTVVTDGGEEIGSASYDGGTDATTESEPDSELGPTAREETLLDEIDDILAGGPEKYKDQLPDQGKLFVRDRIDLWFGDDFLFEDGKFAAFDDWHPDGANTAEDDDDRLPADGLITGAAEFEGRDVHFMANDYTVKRGSMAAKGVEKFLRMQQRALKTGKPVLYLMDSSGGRIDQQTGFFANREGIGKYYYNHSMLSGRVPRSACFTVPVSPAQLHPRLRGLHRHGPGRERDGHRQPADGRNGHRRTDRSPGTGRSGRPRTALRECGPHRRGRGTRPRTGRPTHRLSPEQQRRDSAPVGRQAPAASPDGIDAVVPQEPNKGYDMFDVIDRIVDAGSTLELRSEYGPEIITAFARIDGRPIGIVANQPAHRAGAIFPDAAEKAAEFIWTCDAYDIPLLYLCDTPGFMAGSQVEKDGILEQGKKMIYATSSATVPKQSVVVRKAYGAGIYAMSGPAYDPESVIGLPSGEIAIMGPEAAINAVYARKLAEIDDEEERKRMEQELREEYREDIDVHRMASEVVIDEIVPPSDLREELEARFAFYETVEKDLPDKKHGTVL